MLDKKKHEIVLRRVLDAIYGSNRLSHLLGFKGGTACYFFHELPRFSTDLDFNLLRLDKKEEVFEELKKVLEKFGRLKEQIIKKNTIFFLLIHTEGQAGIKIEVSTRESELVNEYEIKEFYGRSLSLMKKEFLFANKLLALTMRKRATPRDLFDVNYFFNRGWDIAKEPIHEVLGKALKEYIEELPEYIEKNFSKNTILDGLGQLFESKDDISDVKENLIRDSVVNIQMWLDSN
jgi:predicted nucleotidyltransferase component of viral defense system